MRRTAESRVRFASSKLSPLRCFMPRIKLTDKVVKALSTVKDSEEFIDNDFRSGEFGVRVSSAGRKAFFLRYRVDGRKGKRSRLPLGTYPAVSLAAAREKALSSVAEVQNGVNPAMLRQEKRKADTVGALFDAYMLQKESSFVRSTYRNYWAMWKKDCEKLLGDMKPADIERRHIIELLDNVESRTDGPHMANRVRTMLMSMFNWAVAKDRCKYNPVLGVSKAQKRELPCERFLSRDEIRKYWESSEELDTNSRVFWRLLLLLALRPGEVMKLEWRWIDDEVLTIPGSAVKNKREHQLYLTDSARAEIKLLEPLSAHTGFLFPGHQSESSRKTFKLAHDQMLKKMAVPHWTPRDIRRTCETQMRTFIRDSEGISRVLNHDVSAIRRHYDRGDYFDRKRDVLIKWGRWVEDVVVHKDKQRVVNLTRYLA